MKSLQNTINLGKVKSYLHCPLVVDCKVVELSFCWLWQGNAGTCVAKTSCFCSLVFWVFLNLRRCHRLLKCISILQGLQKLSHLDSTWCFSQLQQHVKNHQRFVFTSVVTLAVCVCVFLCVEPFLCVIAAVASIETWSAMTALLSSRLPRKPTGLTSCLAAAPLSSPLPAQPLCKKKGRGWEGNNPLVS